MAKEINEHPGGTVTWIYMTSDGGASPSLFEELVPMLREHVEVVDHNNIVDLALQRG